MRGENQDGIYEKRVGEACGHARCACTGQDPLRALRDLCVEAIENLGRDEQKGRIFTILLHRCEFTEELREAEERHQAFIQQFIALSERLFEASAERLRPSISPRLASRALHALIIGLFTDWTREPTLFDPLLDSAALIDTQFRGLVRDWE